MAFFVLLVIIEIVGRLGIVAMMFLFGSTVLVDAGKKSASILGFGVVVLREWRIDWLPVMFLRLAYLVLFLLLILC